jgi:hypothetical protein
MTDTPSSEEITDGMTALIDELKQENSELISSLHQNGIELNPLVMLKMRLDIVTEYILSISETPRELFEMEWEAALNETLKAAAASSEDQGGGLIIP